MTSRNNSFGRIAFVGVLVLSVIGAVTPRATADDVDDLKRRVEQLERTVEELERRLEQLNAPSPPSSVSNGAAASPSGSTGVQSAGSASGSGNAGVVITVKSFKAATANPDAQAEASRLETDVKKFEQELAALQQQKTKLYDLMKELEKRWMTGRAMSEEEYKRLALENKNQRDDISKRMARIENDRNIARRKQGQAKKDSKADGQVVEGIDASGQSYVVTTKVDCSKILALGVQVSFVNLKITSSSSSGNQGTADKVVLVK